MNNVYVSYFSLDRNVPKQRIGDAVESAAPDVVHKIWEELDYRTDVFRVIRRTRTEVCLRYA